jgi:hypothetical protein
MMFLNYRLNFKKKVFIFVCVFCVSWSIDTYNTL